VPPEKKKKKKKKRETGGGGGEELGMRKEEKADAERLDGHRKDADLWVLLGTVSLYNLRAAILPTAQFPHPEEEQCGLDAL
jgi:hypothetical protein